ncbi:LacI family DNA-binding transcriptional regulator [Pseudorhizobium pelagicum]|uniref:LacI family DNA-binding transcriptional regulator n=1 Tax=Pseudorhizobium pelagicum TaxID=1509405 RepID=UPI000A50B056|nr:LacI family DNA-binding transcriptional regulator [Pseudorhizobium pelagicum]
MKNDRKRTKVTLLDVARQANVSRATASLVIRKSPLVGAGTRKRVEEAMHALGYVYNMGAARLRAKRSHTIGVIVPNLTNPFFAELLGGIEAAIDDAGLVMIIANSGDLVSRQSAVMQRMREHGVDGIILCPAAGTGQDLPLLIASWTLPVVQVLRHVTSDLDYAGADYAAGMHQAVDHLASLGHRSVALAVHGPLHSAYQERVESFRQAMTDQGLQMAIIRVPDELAQIADAMHLFVDRPERFTAIVCFNDLVALGMAAGIHDCGLAVGRDISLVGFDDVSDAEAMRPRLTSVSTAPVTIGRNAATLLVERIERPSLPPRRIISPTYLKERQSCQAVSPLATKTGWLRVDGGPQCF